MKARIDAKGWIGEDNHDVVLELERSDKDELFLRVRWPDYMESPGVDFHFSDVNAAVLAGALAAIVGAP